MALGNIINSLQGLSPTDSPTFTNLILTGALSYPAIEVTGTTQLLAVNSKYIANNAAIVVFTLPAIAAIGDMFFLRGKGAGLYSVGVTTGQIINFGSSACTVSTGKFTATNRYDCLAIECITANTTFIVTNSQGNFTPS